MGFKIVLDKSKGKYKNGIDLNEKGIRELLKSNEVKECITEVANDIQNKAGKGYEVSVRTLKKRSVANIYAKDREAIQDNLENNTLLKALPSGSYKVENK